jgi:hypothetical protein
MSVPPTSVIYELIDKKILKQSTYLKRAVKYIRLFLLSNRAQKCIWAS